MTSQRWWSGALILLGLLVVLVFIPGLSDEFTWDDNGLIRTNEHIQQPEHYREALTTHFWNVSRDAVESNETYDHLYRPLVTLAYIIQFRLFGFRAAGYRVVSLALHLLCCLLAFFWLARRLPPGKGLGRLVAIGLGVAVFTFHPSRVEAVSWISGSTELWMCALVLMAALAFDSKRNWMAGILLALALFAKESSIVAAPLLLADRFLVRGQRDREASVALTAPVIVALLVRFWMVDVAAPSAAIRDAVPRMLASFGVYAQQVLSPWSPTAFPGMRTYSCNSGETLSTEWMVAGTLLVVGVVSLGVVALRRNAWRPAFADSLWIVVPLLPVVNLLDLGNRNLTADRFLYLPMLGVAALLARGVLSLLERRPVVGKVCIVAVAVLIAGFAVVTSLHARVFASSSSFWEYEAQRNPDNPFALHAVGTARSRAGLEDTGLEFLKRAQIVADRTCVHVDQLRAAKDLAFALSLRTSPDERETLTKLQATYLGVPTDGLFEYDGLPGWSVQLTPEETVDLVSNPLHYGLPLATIEARLGHVDEAASIVETFGSVRSQLGPQAQSLRLRLLAAQGHVRQSLIELVKQSSVADVEGLTSVLATLHETLEHAQVAPNEQSSLASYSLGFGQTPEGLEPMTPRDQTILSALRAYSTNQPVDVEALQPIIENSNELPRFIQVAQAQTKLRNLDAKLKQ